MSPAAGHDRRLVLGLSLAQLVAWGSVFYGFSLFVAPVEAALGLGRAESTLAFSLALLAEGVLAWPVGRWIDRGHERAVMTGGSLVLALGLALHSRVEGAAGFYAVWLLLGAGLAATLYTPVFAVVTRRFPDDFRRAIITLTFLGGLASTVFIPLTAWLIAALGWRHALLVLAALQLLVCVPLHALLLRGAPAVVPCASGEGTAAAGPRGDGGGAAGAHGDGSLAAGPGTLARSPAFLLIGCFVVGMMAVTAALPPHMVTLLRESGLPPAWVIAIPASIGAIQVAGRLLLFFFEHRFDLHLANRLIPWLIPAGVAALLAAGSSPQGALLFVALYGLGNGMLTIVKGTAVAQYVSRAHAASLNGALGLPTALARALAPMVLGLLWTREAGYRWGLALLLAVAAASALALWGAQRRALESRT